MGEWDKSFSIDFKTSYEESFAVFKMRLKSECIGIFLSVLSKSGVGFDSVFFFPDEMFHVVM